MTIPPSYDDDSTDPLAARLRAALNSEANMVNPSDDGLHQIRQGVESTRRPWWRHPAAPALAAAAVLGLMAGGIAVAFGGDDDGKDGNVVAGETSSASTSASPSPSPTPSETPTEATETPSARDNVYVYYVMDDTQGPRLYRELHALEPKDVPQAIYALTELFTQPAVDPDYSSLWPSEPLTRGYKVVDGTAIVDLAEFPKLGSEAETVAVQQLVYTVTANDSAVKRVQLLVDGEAPTSGHHDWSKPVTRAPMVDVQGMVWLLGPTEGATVSSPVKISGYGTAFEGTVSWEVYRMDKAVATDTKVAEGFTQAGANGEFDEFSDSVELEPGTYEMRAFESSAEDGRPIHVDSKTFTVE